MEADGTFDLLPKKEVVGLRKEYDKLNKLLCGIRETNKLPNALFIVDPSKEYNAINEARKLNIPVFGIVDTNCDPDMCDYVIPGNDDAIRAVKLITGVMANAICEAQGLELVDYVSENKKEDGKEIMEKALETVKKKEPRRFEDRKPFDKNKNFKNGKPERANKEEAKKETKEVEVKKEEKAETKDLSTLTVNELREMAKDKDIKGYSTMKKAELVDALK